MKTLPAESQLMRRLSRVIGRITLSFALILTAGLSVDRGSGATVRLGWIQSSNRVDVSWVSPSITLTAPFLHYEFQVEQSSNLTSWASVGTPIAGGFLSTPATIHSAQLPATNLHSFVRLSFRLNMPGANLSGLDLRGADLRGAHLANANLSGTQLDGALLGGADLTGANLSGVTLTNTDLQNVNLDGFNWTGLDLSRVQGMPSLTVLRGNAGERAAAVLPELPFNPPAEDFVVADPYMVGVGVSKRNAVVMLNQNATVAQVNALMQKFNASMVGSHPQDATLTNGLVVLRFPTETALASYELTQALEHEESVAAAAPDILLGYDTLPDDAQGASGQGLCNGMSFPALNWTWDAPPLVTGGNWGWEMARVPQMWNLNRALTKNGARRVVTCVYDGGFPVHPDLQFTSVLGPSGIL